MHGKQKTRRADIYLKLFYHYYLLMNRERYNDILRDPSFFETIDAKFKQTMACWKHHLIRRIYKSVKTHIMNNLSNDHEEELKQIYTQAFLAGIEYAHENMI